MLTALPVAVSAGGVPLFDVVEDALPVPDLSTFDGRLRAATEWLGLPSPPIVYDEEDPEGGVLLTPELMGWLEVTDFKSHLRWLFDGDPTATPEAQRARLRQDREVLSLFRSMDETEQRIFLEVLPRFADRSIPTEVVQAETLARLDAHRAAKRARVQ